MKWLEGVIAAFPAGERFLNEKLIEHFASSTKPRPHPFSLWGPTRPTEPAPVANPAPAAAFRSPPSPSAPSCYTSWPSLVDRTFTGRHLPPCREDRSYPEIDEVVGLLSRAGAMVPSERSSVLFCYFAQWFTDSFLRKHPLDPRRNTSNHEIDLCQIYGLDEPSTWALREGRDGRLKSRMADGEEYPLLLYKDGELDPQFFDATKEVGLSFLRAGRAPLWEKAVNEQSEDALKDPARRDYFHAAGLDRAGSTVAYSALNTIFLREHNRIAGALAGAYSGERGWDDDRLFETARMVNIRQILTVVVNDYIRHLGGVFPFTLDTTFAERQAWYRTNRISIEFNLLYRWHSLIPEELELGDGRTVDFHAYRFNNRLLEENGIEAIISAASTQKAGRYGLFNTPGFMRDAEVGGLTWARMFGVQPFNRYRERFGLDPYDGIEALTGGDLRAADALKAVYGDDVDEVEFSIGLLAEGRGAGELMPETTTRMVAYDAFTHILTNPLLAGAIHRPETFSEVGWDILQENATLAQIVQRNVRRPEAVTVSLSA